MLPQFFRHFIPKMQKSSQGSYNVYTKQSDRSKDISYPKKASDNYHELDEQSHRLKANDTSNRGGRLWTDEIAAGSVASDEERGFVRGPVG